MMVLHRNDCFAGGDTALVKSIKEVKDLPALTSKQEILSITETWKPFRTVAAFLLWHAYIKKRNLKF
jgi:DNA-3-methyladenine glycosylase II